MSEQNAEKRPITPGKIKAPLRGVDSAVVSSVAHLLQYGTAPTPTVLLEEERPERSTCRMALIAA